MGSERGRRRAECRRLPSRRCTEWLLPPGNSGPAAESRGGGGGTVCFEHRVGHTRKWRREGAAPTPGDGAVGTGRRRGRHGTLGRECQPRVQSGRGREPVSFWLWFCGGKFGRVLGGEGLVGAPGLVKGCSGRRGPCRTSFSFWGLGIFRSPSLLPLLGRRVEESCTSEQVSPGAESPLEFVLLLGGGERPLWWGLLLFGLIYPS